MEGAPPTTALVPVAAGTEAAPLAPAAPGVLSFIPVDDTAQKKSLRKHFTTLRQVVEVKEMELDALCASHGLGASLGCLLIKNGSRSQRVPFIEVDPPFDITKMYDGKHPLMNRRLRCDRMHNQAAEKSRNSSGHCSQSATYQRPRSSNKGGPTPAAPALLLKNAFVC